MNTTIRMEAIALHTHYDATGARVTHEPGTTYEITDGLGMTAIQLAESLENLHFAKRVPNTTKAAAAKPRGRSEEREEQITRAITGDK